jgi:predicted NACHT family NTPase
MAKNSDYSISSQDGLVDSEEESPPRTGRKKIKIHRIAAKPRNNKTILEESKESSASVSDEHSDHIDAETANRKIYGKKRDRKETLDLDNYELACQKLQLNAIPDELPCRDSERKKITEYLESGLKNKKSSSSLYISGMPGTGKTVTTLQVIAKIRARMNFEFTHINAMSLTNPNLVYTIIHEEITKRRVNPASAALFLDEFFKKKDKTKILLDAWPKTADR